MMKLFIKAYFWKVIPKGYKIKQSYITKNYHFQTRKYSSFLNFLAIYIKGSYTKGIKNGTFRPAEYLLMKRTVSTDLGAVKNIS